VAGVELLGSLVGVDRVGDLVVARLVQRSKVEPHLCKIRVDSDRARVGVEGVVELVDFVVENSDRAPERWVLAVAVDCLLVRLVRLAKVVRRHVRPSEEVPRESVVRI
jgi:hypothetical protein